MFFSPYFVLLHGVLDEKNITNMEERCVFLEEEIPRIESSIAHTEEQLGVFVSAAETQRLTVLAEELRGQLESLTAEWEDLMEQLEW